jgi:hypothetical protein
MRRERRRWLVALVVAFVLGWLLAWFAMQATARGCARSPADDGAQQAGRGNVGTHGAPDKGSGVKLNAGIDGDSRRRPPGGTTTADGGGAAGGKGGPGDGDLGRGTPWQAKGDAPDANGSSNSPGEADAGDSAGSGSLGNGRSENATPLSMGEPQGQGPQPGTGPPPSAGGTPVDDQAAPADPGTASAGNALPDSRGARDLRYDKSELPRYPNAVTQTASVTPALNGPKPADPNLSVSAIITRDDLPTVAAWYHEHLPGWTEQSLGQMAMFWPPDRKTDPRTVWLVVDSKSGQTEALLWKPRVKDQ